MSVSIRRHGEIARNINAISGLAWAYAAVALLNFHDATGTTDEFVDRLPDLESSDPHEVLRGVAYVMTWAYAG